MIFVYLEWLIDISEFHKINITRVVYCLGIILLICISISYSRYANIVYLKAEFEQKRAISYFTTLITKIKSTEGYQDELSVVYINSENKKDLTLKELDGFTLLDMPAVLDIDKTINSYVWIQFMNDWCAFEPEYADEEEFKNLPEVIEMPYYPDDGSIRIINDTVVVKFGPVEEEN